MFDALTIAAVVDELNATILGGRIQRVLALDRLTLGLEVYARQRYQLLLSAGSRDARVHLVREGKLTADVEVVTPLLLLLRKFARGARIVEISQVALERIVHLRLGRVVSQEVEAELDWDGAIEPEAPDPDVYEFVLAIEIMGRHSNLILIDGTGRIVDSAKRVPSRLSRVRTVLPRGQYVVPPAQDKADPRVLTPAALAEMLAADRAAPLPRLLVAGLRGVSPQLAREVAHRASGNIDSSAATFVGREEAVIRALAEVLGPLESGAWSPHLYRDADGRPVAFSPIPLYHQRGPGESRVDSISAAAERYFAATAGVVAHQQRKAALSAVIGHERARIAARERSLVAEAARARQVEQWRAWGEAIFASAWSIQPGQAELVVDGLRVPLDPRKSAVENARHYFEQYRKAQSGAERLPGLLATTRANLGYLDQLLTLIRLAEGYDAIAALDREWRAWLQEHAAAAAPPGSVRTGSSGVRKRPTSKRPHAYRAGGGALIYVGTTGLQNDAITFEIAGANDTWLHARGVPGAHVLVRWPGGTPDDEVLRLAAELAAGHSGAGTSAWVEVDCAARRDVKKIKGAGPGMVTYRHERTVRVAPRTLAELLRAGLLRDDAASRA